MRGRSSAAGGASHSTEESQELRCEEEDEVKGVVAEKGRLPGGDDSTLPGVSASREEADEADEHGGNPVGVVGSGGSGGYASEDLVETSESSDAIDGVWRGG